MATTFCDCNLGLRNTGIPTVGCLPIMKVTASQFIMSTHGSDGTRNKIPAAQDLDQAYLDGKINEADWRDRWFPISKYENVEDTTEDPKTEEFPSGKTVFIREGATSFKGFLVGVDSLVYQQLKGYGCVDISVFNVDIESNLAYLKIDETGDKYPVGIDQDTFWTRKVKATDETTIKAEVNFQYDQSQSDADIRVLLSSDIDADLAGASGLIDVIGVESGVATPGTASISLSTVYNTVITGLVLVDFEMFNVTTQLAVVITTATENPAGSGTYDMVFPAQTALDEVYFDVVKEGLDGDTLKELIITL